MTVISPGGALSAHRASAVREGSHDSEDQRAREPARLLLGWHLLDWVVWRSFWQSEQHEGFVDGLAASGWDIRFNWGDANAWESDWRRNDDTWVDAVDFVFYTGHANSDGWVLSTPDDDFLHFSETAGAADLWGQKNLEWAVVAACGPLQYEVVGSGGDVLDRWRNAFDGLHILMGYAQVTYDNEEEGKRLAQYAKNGGRSSSLGSGPGRDPARGNLGGCLLSGRRAQLHR